jgi:LmbE family N-acetylglucosaminyl deacetylase
LIVWLLPLILVLLLAVTWLVARVAKYRQSVPYSPKFDYFYGFDEEHVIGGECDGQSLRLPTVNASIATLVAEVHVESGPISDNQLILKLGEKKVGASFERGATGKRLLDVTAFLAELHKGPAEIRIKGNGMALKAGPVKLCGFKSPLEAPRIMVIAPHPDDAEIAAFGLYSDHAATTTIVTVTAGDDSLRYRDVASGLAEASLLSAQIRVYDSLVCGTWGGVSPARSVSLGYFDGKLDEMRRRSPAVVTSKHLAFTSPSHIRPASSAKAEASWSSLVEDLREQILAQKPDVIVTPHPVLDCHSDHVAATLAVCEAMLATPAANPKLLLYVNHHRMTEAYPFGSIGDGVHLPPAEQDAHGCRRVYSHPLDYEMRRRKMFALDNMHALRDVPEPIRKGVLKRELVNWLRRTLLSSDRYDFNYYRRSLRSNELFFVVDPLEVRGFYEGVVGNLDG